MRVAGSWLDRLRCCKAPRWNDEQWPAFRGHLQANRTSASVDEAPDDRRTIEAGTLVLEHAEPQDAGPCRDINYDPLVLPAGVAAAHDPLLPARSAGYADSYLRRASEEAHLPG